jgi:thioester reductase-like protein
MRDGKTIVLTGASGVVGRALLTELAGRPVIALVHQDSVDGARSVRCDVSRDRLGLDPDAYRRLAHEADVIVHAAGETDWAAPAERFAQINVRGTENVLALARDADVPLYHISTSFVWALRADAPLLLPDDNLIVNYVRSKIECERMLAESAVPHAVFRPTNLIGDSRTGAIARTQMVQLVSEFICRGKLPVFPARPDVLVDIVPQDVLARAVVAVLDAEEIGTEYWVTAGADALTVAQTVDACVRFMERIGRPIDRPQVVDPEQVDLDSPEFGARLSPMARAFFGRLRDISDGMTACGIFPTSLQELASRHGVEHGSFAEAYVRGLEWWAEDKGLLSR